MVIALSFKNSIKNNSKIIRQYDNALQFYYKLFTDEKLIKKRFKKEFGQDIDLSNPVTFSEKLQWLKLNWRSSIATSCVDKFAVREFIKNKIGSQYLNELYGVYDSVEEVNTDILPKSFVIKGTHGSGFNLIVKDKEKVDWSSYKNTMNRWLNINYFWKNREWVYKDIKPRIVVEKFLNEKGSDGSLTDYKFYCFNGIVRFCQVIRGRGVNETIDFYDNNWVLLPFTGLRKMPNSNKEFKKPAKFEEMIELAETLASSNFPFVRVDFYYVEEKIIFGEMTFFPMSGYGRFYPDVWNRKIGDLLSVRDL